MAIKAIALLSLPAPLSQLPASVQIEQLDDALLVHLQQDFAEEPEQLAATLQELLGVQLVAHRDPRGIFFIPAVAAPKARTYHGVIDEVGEGGVWASLPELDLAALSGLDLRMGSSGSLLSQGLLEKASAATQGNPEALQAMASEVEAMMGKSEALRSLASQMSGLLGGMAAPGGGPPGPAQMEQVFAALQTQLAQNPDQLTKMVEQLFGGPAEGADDEDGEEPGK
jgi:hypothetical protein